MHIFAFCERAVCKYNFSKYLTAQDSLSSPYRKMSLSSWLVTRLDGVLCSDSLWSFFKKTLRGGKYAHAQHVRGCLSFTFHHKSRLRNKTHSVDWPCSRSSVWDTCCVCVCQGSSVQSLDSLPNSCFNSCPTGLGCLTISWVWFFHTAAALLVSDSSLTVLFCCLTGFIVSLSF